MKKKELTWQSDCATIVPKVSRIRIWLASPGLGAGGERAGPMFSTMLLAGSIMVPRSKSLMSSLFYLRATL